jgi:hypothetical protein
MLFASSSSSAALSIGIVVFPNVTPLDVTGPYEIFARMPATTVHLMAATLAPIRSEHGLTIVPELTFDTAPPLDVVCAPGGIGVNAAMEDEALLGVLAASGPRCALFDVRVHRGLGSWRGRAPSGIPSHDTLAVARSAPTLWRTSRRPADRDRSKSHHRRRCHSRDRLRVGRRLEAVWYRSSSRDSADDRVHPIASAMFCSCSSKRQTRRSTCPNRRSIC